MTPPTVVDVSSVVEVRAQASLETPLSTVVEVRAPASLETRLRRPLRILGSLVVLAFLVRQLGAGPFLDGLHAVRPWSLAAALLLTAGTTWCCAQRWSLIAARHGVNLSVGTAYAAYYRSQLINSTVPGGVIGDVDRSVRHGWRPVVWERAIGQVVQIGLVGTLLLPGPWRWLGLAALVLVLGSLTTGSLRRSPSDRLEGPSDRLEGPSNRLEGLAPAAALSALNTTGHLLVFLVAAQAVGVGLPLSTLIPIGALVLLGASIPFNIGGWGPREGVAAWAFVAFGSTAAVGLTVAVAFGVLSTAATLPGLLVLGRRRD